jgi:FkbM family methyltransferase
MKIYLAECKWGVFLLLRGDVVSTYANLYGKWAETEISLLQLLLQPGQNLIEVGSNIGLHTVPLAKVVGNGKVICFEAQRVLYQILCANCALNNLTNVHAYRAAVGKERGVAEIACSDYEKPWNYAAFSVREGFDYEGCFKGNQWTEVAEIVTLDGMDVVKRLESLRLIKLDAEGMEREVLYGAAETIEKHKPFIFAENNREIGADALIHTLHSFGYTCYWCISPRYRRNNYNRVGIDVGGHDVNMLCVPAGQKSPWSNLPEAVRFADVVEGRVKPIMVADSQ